MARKKRRGNGEGSIYKHKSDGRWCGQYTLPAGSKSKCGYVYGKTHKEAMERKQEAQSRADKGLYFDKENETLGKYLERWLEETVRDNVKSRTFSNYRLQVRRHIVPALGRVKLKNLSPAHVRSFYRAKLDEGLAPGSVRYIHDVLHGSLEQAKKDGLPRNVTEAVDPPTLFPHPLSAEQVISLATGAEKTQNGPSLLGEVGDLSDPADV